MPLEGINTGKQHPDGLDAKTHFLGTASFLIGESKAGSGGTGRKLSTEMRGGKASRRPQGFSWERRPKRTHTPEGNRETCAEGVSPFQAPGSLDWRLSLCRAGRRGPRKVATACAAAWSSGLQPRPEKPPLTSGQQEGFSFCILRACFLFAL